MTRKEKQTVLKAIDLLYADDGFERAVMLLGDLAGVETIHHRLAREDLRATPIYEIPRIDRAFRAFGNGETISDVRR